MSQRPFPQAVDAERALLGGLLQDPIKLDEVRELVAPPDFYREEHKKLFELLHKMQDGGEKIDLITVPERISREGQAETYGGIAYVVTLPDHCPSTANLGVYADLVRQKSLLRQIVAVSSDLRERALLDPEDVDQLVTDAMRQVNLLGLERGSETWVQISELLDDELTRIETRAHSGGDLPGVTTGFLDLDQKLAGLHPTDLVILAARPAMGKTAFALNIAQNVAVMADRAVGVFSLEMSRRQLVNRMLCCHALVDAEKVRTGKIAAEDLSRLLDSSNVLSKARVHIDDTPNLSISEVRNRSRRLKARDPSMSLIVVDYLQLMRGDDPRAPREQQVAAISRGLKALAKELDVNVIALSQLNRSLETRAEKRPMTSDLRESGSIEQDADIIMFIYRDEVYNPETDDKGIAEIIIAKQRGGAIGTVRLAFQGQFTRFDNLASEGEAWLG